MNAQGEKLIAPVGPAGAIGCFDGPGPTGNDALRKIKDNLIRIRASHVKECLDITDSIIDIQSILFEDTVEESERLGLIKRWLKEGRW